MDCKSVFCRIFLTAFLFPVFVFGQPGGPPPKVSEEAREQIEAARVAFITKQLDLSPEEAQQFWPLFNEYEAKKDKIRSELMEMRRGLRNQSDEELEADMKRAFELRRQEIALEEAYTEKFKAVISVRQIANLRLAEHEFKRLMLRRLRERRGGRGG